MEEDEKYIENIRRADNTDKIYKSKIISEKEFPPDKTKNSKQEFETNTINNFQQEYHFNDNNTDKINKNERYLNTTNNFKSERNFQTLCYSSSGVESWSGEDDDEQLFTFRQLLSPLETISEEYGEEYDEEFDEEYEEKYDEEYNKEYNEEYYKEYNEEYNEEYNKKYNEEYNEEYYEEYNEEYNDFELDDIDDFEYLEKYLEEQQTKPDFYQYEVLKPIYHTESSDSDSNDNFSTTSSGYRMNSSSYESSGYFNDDSVSSEDYNQKGSFKNSVGILEDYYVGKVFLGKCDYGFKWKIQVYESSSDEEVNTNNGNIFAQHMLKLRIQNAIDLYDKSPNGYLNDTVENQPVESNLNEPIEIKQKEVKISNITIDKDSSNADILDTEPNIERENTLSSVIEKEKDTILRVTESQVECENFFATLNEKEEGASLSEYNESDLSSYLETSTLKKCIKSFSSSESIVSIDTVVNNSNGLEYRQKNENNLDEDSSEFIDRSLSSNNEAETADSSTEAPKQKPDSSDGECVESNITQRNMTSQFRPRHANLAFVASKLPLEDFQFFYATEEVIEDVTINETCTEITEKVVYENEDETTAINLLKYSSIYRLKKLTDFELKFDNR